jgi:hypothetical protein
MIRPIGVHSKKRTGQQRIVRNILSWSSRRALAPAYWPIPFDEKESRTDATERTA